ncbi:unnamed protein product [Alopecurus aequalis]
MHRPGCGVGQSGCVSIDCGLEDALSGRTDSATDIVYVSDGTYVDGGENHKIAEGQLSSTNSTDNPSLLTLRSFPSGLRNCYTLPTQNGTKYLVRVFFFHGKYDGTSSPLFVQFDLDLGTSYRDTITLRKTTDSLYNEAIFIVWASWVPVCLVNRGTGTPFVNTMELRPLGDELYPDVDTDHSMSTYARVNFGATTTTRYVTTFSSSNRGHPQHLSASSSLEYLSTEETITQQDQDDFEVPIVVLQTAAAAANNGTVLHVRTWEADLSSLFTVFLYFTDYQNNQLRQFNIYVNDEQLGNYSPTYLNAYTMHNSGWSNTSDDNYNITLSATNISVLPPMISAYEIYKLIPNDTSRTFSKDFDAMMAIKHEYRVKKNWMGDPCFPANYAWNGVKCSNSTGNTMRILSLDMSNSNLSGSISDNFTMLTQLQFLDLSGNNLNGTIPDSFCHRNAGSLVFSYEGEAMCNNTISTHPSRNITTIVSISIVIPMVAVIVAILVLSYLIWRGKRKPKSSTHDPPREQELLSAPGSTKSHVDHLQNTENRRFTYKELEKLTNKFERFIGQGGFGPVYYGRLEDGSDVAVELRSESSSHGLDEFLAEVHSLTTVHHRNLVSLVGYCWEKDHLALVYEYMSRGNLWENLRGLSIENLNWATRLQVVLEAAQGLGYLHKGCSLPIIHRDVKTSNILLGQNLRAKCDFGLCKTYISETQTHVSTDVAGSAGYFDPEYYHTGRLTESSDVYSFEVVLLEIATGEPPIFPGHGHIVQRVKQKMATGNISSVDDVRLGGAYEVTSMWKIVDTAMVCTAETSDRRPTMAAMVAQLKESLALDEARKDSGVRISPKSDSAALLSTSGPSAR